MFETPYPETELLTRLAKIRYVALDMDGTIYLDGKLFPCTLPFLKTLDQLGIRHSFLTNNPSKNIADYVARLQNVGIPATRSDVYNTTLATISYLKTNRPKAKRLFLMGTPSLIEEFENAGYESTGLDPSDEPDALVVGFDMTLTYEKLCRAAWWAAQKNDDGSCRLPYLATNPDRVCPTSQPTILVDCGSMYTCIEHATGRKPDRVLGKPDPGMLNGIIAQNGLRPEEIAMVGDRIYTDIAMARNANAFGVLVLSGETTEEAAKTANPPADLTCSDLSDFADALTRAHG